MIRVVKGKCSPLGCTLQGHTANFALFSAHATQVTLALFWSDGEETPDQEVPLEGPKEGCWCIGIEALPPHACYAYRVDGHETPFHVQHLLADPYGRLFANACPWGDASKSRIPFLCYVAPPKPFDWQGVQKPKIPLQNLIVYEMHVRGFTMSPSSNVPFPGTYAGVIEKIPYLQKLGINAIELLPVFEFDEMHTYALHPTTQELLPNYWGYSPVSFFVPMRGFAIHPTQAIDEFKMLVREAHRAGIEVILDVVYNHTTEYKEYIVSFKGIDPLSYYLFDEKGEDRNYSGCGNTFQANGKPGMRLILDSLIYWAEEMQVDGFRFDLASILTRSSTGEPLAHPPLLAAMAKEPQLKGVKLIAEPWDLGGLYQLNQFPKWGPWSTWNGLFRDHVRRFIKGTDGEAGHFAAVLCGSEPFYGADLSPQASVNFITAHDGFCLSDLVSYQQKHNLENGEQNRDGNDHNESWNCGAEGATDDPLIQALRQRQMRNFWLALFFSQGIPMMLMGDEVGLTRNGNNNPYAQDNETNWFDWSACKTNRSMLQFVSQLIAFRKKHVALHKTAFLTKNEIDWHEPDWSSTSRFVSFTLKGTEPLLIAFNADYRSKEFSLPSLPASQHWRLLVNTKDPWERNFFHAPELGPTLPRSVELIPYSALVAKAFS